MRTNIILGPPGTGKTTKLLDIMETELNDNIMPEQIGFVSFTKKAASEAKERAVKKFSFKQDELRFFRTLHSLAFHWLKMDKEDVMGFINYLDICNMLGLTITSQSQYSDEGLYGVVQTKGDRLFFLENLARATGLGLKATHAKFINDDLDFQELVLLSKTIKKYKEVRDKIDFTDMILKFNAVKQTPDLQVLIVDEAQDLQPAQWDMVELLARRTPRVYIAGDDDQAIYNWAGADITRFNDYPGEREVLHQSYRVPGKVHKKAVELSKRIHNRQKKEYKPTPNEGVVEYHQELDTIDMSEGTWLLLARNIFLLGQYSDYCANKGYYYWTRYGSEVDMDAAKAICTWESLRNQNEEPAYRCKTMYKYMNIKTRVRWGFKQKLEALDDDEPMTLQRLIDGYGLLTREVWHKALNKIKPDDKAYFINLIKNGEQMSHEPRIRINTIHGVKGGEADNVVILSDMSRRTYAEFERNPDDELRVWYVAMTRTKNALHIIHPTTSYAIDI